MTKLTQAQQAMLAEAAQAETGSIDATDAAKATAVSLIKRGLLMSIPHTEGSSRLSITQCGRDAIGAPQADAAKPKPPASPATSAPAPKPAARAPTGKIASLVAMLRQADGATIEVMMAATGWQPHSVRGALSGAIKKGLGLTVVSEKADGLRRYRIAPETEA